MAEGQETVDGLHSEATDMRTGLSLHILNIDVAESGKGAMVILQ